MTNTEVFVRSLECKEGVLAELNADLARIQLTGQGVGSFDELYALRNDVKREVKRLRNLVAA